MNRIYPGPKQLLVLFSASVAGLEVPGFRAHEAHQSIQRRL